MRQPVNGREAGWLSGKEYETLRGRASNANSERTCLRASERQRAVRQPVNGRETGWLSGKNTKPDAVCGSQTEREIAASDKHKYLTDSSVTQITTQFFANTRRLWTNSGVEPI